MKDVVNDYHRFMNDSGYAVLSDWTCIRVTGADRTSFLNNLCTNDVARLRPDQGCEAFFTDVKGHILAHVMLLCRPDEVLLWTLPGQADSLTRHLDKYLIREDVTLENLSPDVRLFLVGGPRRWQAMGRDHAADLGNHLANTSASIGSTDALLVACDWFGPESVLVQVPADEADGLQSELVVHGAAVDPGALEMLRVESGTPLFGVDFDARNLPQEINRDKRAISFTKGCYLGQETVARIDALGHVNKLLVSVRFAAEDVPAASTTLLAGEKEVGQVTSAVWSPRLQSPLGLAMVRRGFNGAGTALSSAAGAAEVLSLPPLLDVQR